MGNGPQYSDVHNGLPSAAPDISNGGTNRGLGGSIGGVIGLCGDIRRAGDGPQTWSPTALDSSDSFTPEDGAIKSDTLEGGSVLLGGDAPPSVSAASGTPILDSAAEGSNACHSPARRG
jgi:hypothetical protein